MHVVGVFGVIRPTNNTCLNMGETKRVVEIIKENKWKKKADSLLRCANITKKCENHF